MKGSRLGRLIEKNDKVSILMEINRMNFINQ